MVKDLVIVNICLCYASACVCVGWSTYTSVHMPTEDSLEPDSGSGELPEMGAGYGTWVLLSSEPSP